MNNLIKYSVQLAMLSTLLDEKLITKREFLKIKADLESKYRINKNLCG